MSDLTPKQIEEAKQAVNNGYYCSYPGACFNCDRMRAQHPDRCLRFLVDNPPWGPVDDDCTQAFADIMRDMGW